MRHVHPDIRIPNLRDENEIPDPLRMRRERERWPGIDEAMGTSRIVVLDHGGRARPVIHRGSEHRRSRLVSWKTRRMQIAEGNGLPFLCRRWEVDATVADWQAHPFLITTVVAGERVEWFPDGVVSRFCAAPELVEVKRSPDDLGDSAYRRKLSAMAELARRIGWTMTILYDADISGKGVIARARRKNVEAVYSRRFLKMRGREEEVVAAIVADGAPISWGDACALIDPNDTLRADAVIECAIARGFLLADLDRSRSGATVLSPFAARGASATFRI